MNDFKSFLKQTEKTSENSAGKKYEEWPEIVKKEIEMMLAANDAGTHNILLGDATSRFKKVHNFEVSKDTLRRYARTVLGRRNWRDPGLTSNQTSHKKISSDAEAVEKKIEITNDRVNELIERANSTKDQKSQRTGFIPSPSDSTPFLKDY